MKRHEPIHKDFGRQIMTFLGSVEIRSRPIRSKAEQSKACYETAPPVLGSDHAERLGTNRAFLINGLAAIHFFAWIGGLKRTYLLDGNAVLKAFIDSHVDIVSGTASADSLGFRALRIRKRNPGRSTPG
jgi:hypothetical protein